jgi:uncharacterized protein
VTVFRAPPLRTWAALALLFLACGASRAAEVIPPAPAAYFNDYAGVIRPDAAAALNTELDQFERATSNQVLVAIYPHMQSDSSIEDYTVRVAQAWGVGQKGKKNGAVLFVFVEDHTLNIEVGYGLEGALPDALCQRIIDDQIVPRIHEGDFTGAMQAGVHSILAATRGEYKGTGSTDAQGGQGDLPLPFVGLIFFILILFSVIRSFQHVVYNGTGRRGYWASGVPWVFMGGGGGGGSSGGGFSGGGFSGGGGSFGGGGASGHW